MRIGLHAGTGWVSRSMPWPSFLEATLLFACRQVAFDDVPAHHNGSAQTFSSGMGAKLKQELQAEMTRLKRARSAASIADSAQVSLTCLHSHQTCLWAARACWAVTPGAQEGNACTHSIVVASRFTGQLAALLCRAGQYSDSLLFAALTGWQ